jgi:hypothetical protein
VAIGESLLGKVHVNGLSQVEAAIRAPFGLRKGLALPTFNYRWSLILREMAADFQRLRVPLTSILLASRALELP